MKKSSLIFIILTGFASFCNYVTYPTLGHLLGPQEFVDVTLALAIFTQVSSFMLSIVALTIGLTKESPKESAKSTVEKLQTILSHIFMLIMVGFLLFSPIILPQLKISAIFFLPILLMLAISLVMSIISGYLNGKQQLVKLGLIISGSAILQLTSTAAVAAITRNGTLALMAMAIASLVAVALTYVACRNDHLPNIQTVLTHRLSVYENKKDRSLLKYTVVASISALALNILLIADLLIVNARQVDTQLYTDIYIVSRIVFFAGMLLVWPFLSNVNLAKPGEMRRNFWLLCFAFIALAVTASVVMAFYGNQVINVLLGSHNTDPRLFTLSLVSIVYKLSFLVMTAACLIFMVYRSYWVACIPILFTAGLFAVSMRLGPMTSTLNILTGLCTVSIVGAIFSIICLYRLKPKHLPAQLH